MPPRARRRLTRAAAAALAVTALATPAAVARPIEDAPGWTASPTAAYPSEGEAPAPTVLRTIEGGFDWGAAGIGAGTAAAIVLLSVAGVRAGSRSEPRPLIRNRGAGMHANSNRRVP